jgi:predicted PurR-regulated permease PerM
MSPYLKSIETPLRYCLTILGFVAGLYFLYQLRNLIVLLFFAFLFMTAVNPMVNFWETKKLSRSFGILITYILILMIISLMMAVVIPPLITQVTVLFNQIKLPANLLRQLSQYQLQDIPMLASQFTSLPKVVSAITGTFSSFIQVITFGVISFYLLMERPNLHHYLLHVMGKNLTEAKIEDFVNSIEKHIGSWVRGQLTVMSIFGLIIFIGLTLMRVEYALPLAILAAACEIIPNIGGILSAAPAIMIAYFMMSPAMAIAVTALYILTQEVEHNVIVPTVMKRVIGINPLVTIILILVGLELGGFGGAILALPCYIVVQAFFQEWHHIK